MRVKVVDGVICTHMGIRPDKVVIRAEKTGNFTTVSLADGKTGLLLQVPYNEIRKVVKGL